MSVVKTAGLVVVGIVLATGTSMFVLMKASDTYVARVIALKEEAEAAKQPEKPWDFWTIEIENLAAELREEKQRLQTYEETLQQREQRLNAEARELDKTRKQLEALRATIDQRLIEVTQDEMANLKKLAQTYASLSPKASLPIYKEMTDDMLVKLLSLMKADVVKATFEEMSKQSAIDPALAKRAALLSERLRLIKPANKPAPGN